MFKESIGNHIKLKISYTKNVWLSIAFALSSAYSFAQSSVNRVYKVTTTEVFKSPVSPLLYGNFIELGYGIQVEPMWSEMFFNRSFETFTKYRDINKLWFDLAYDEKDLSKGYEKDWSKFDWYHSGYQHNAWFAAPGKGNNPFWIEDSSTFFILNSEERKVKITPKKGGSGHGEQYLQVENAEQKLWGGLAQEGKLLKKGESYQFTGKLRLDSGNGDVEIRIYPQGKWDKPLETIKLETLSGNFSERTISFKSKYNDYVTFSLWIAPQTTVSVDDFSLKPTNSYYGWRNDVVEVFKQLQPKVVRFPGGCFASFYDWKDGIGSYSDRKPTDSYFWGGQNYNDVGTAEFAMLCKAANAEMQMCVNVYHPSKRMYDLDFPNVHAAHGYDFPQFMSLTDGAKAAAEWVAYCNLPAGTHPMADLRVKHGYKEPFGAKYWELDNELLRWFEAEDYAYAVMVYSKAMKAIDPTIKIGMCSYGARPGKSDYQRDIDQMLEIAGPYIDFLADRGDAGSLTERMINRVKIYNEKHNTRIRYSDTEWLAYNTEVNRDSYNMAERSDNVTKSFMFGKWAYGMNLLKNFMSFQRMGDEMLFVNFNNLANTHSQSAMESPKEGAYLTASGRALQLLSNSPASRLLQIENYKAEMKDEYQVQAFWDRNREKLVLYVCNRTGEKRNAQFDISAIKRKFSSAKVNQLLGDGPLAMNTLQHQNAIKVKGSISRNPISRNVYSIAVPAWSFSEIVLE